MGGVSRADEGNGGYGIVADGEAPQATNQMIDNMQPIHFRTDFIGDLPARKLRSAESLQRLAYSMQQNNKENSG